MDENKNNEPAHARGRLLELAALFALVGLSLAVYAMGGPTALSAVGGTGVGLFSTWRYQNRPPEG
ncbi:MULTISPECIES: hypothetical protein [Streptomyces]|jgi:hypothetical protein|uniref:Uncharacterized protein n=2 Tax=Streptomyces TaxID=1883 RepID=A0A918LKJ2_STRGD|nr:MULTISPECIES: hypothetical protein [Streptomyces]RIH60603.1 hypothetical protein D3C59_18105 [Streptomyces sp. SHP22-7]MBJ6622145.1 hypothetical protein [Streptomyces sp. DHE17-7]MBX4175993.1 hypothetical protein [Streptomyces geysiriensis]RSS66197.1 hypothetical protein EF907_15540 [Streptomyces sp. WAC06273]WQC17163.1 hypothetical protein TR631_37160 [Streptomyces rochei]